MTPARVRIGYGVANRDKGAQQCRQFKGVELAGQPPGVVGAGGLSQGAALDAAHGVERLPARRARQLVNGDDTRVFELTGDLRLLEEACLERGLLGAFGP
jgi:hypothetical protein